MTRTLCLFSSSTECSFASSWVNSHASSVLLLQKPVFHIPAYSLGIAELPGCLLDCSDLAHPIGTVWMLRWRRHRKWGSSDSEGYPDIYYRLHRHLDETF